jgi:hypothetical protein
MSTGPEFSRRFCRRDVSVDTVNTAQFLAYLFARLGRAEKAIATGAKRTPPDSVQALAEALCAGDVRQAWLRYRAALLSSVFFVALHLTYRISSAGDDDELHQCMQDWRRRLLKSGGDSSGEDDFASEVYSFVEEKGARLAAEDGGMSFTDHLERVVHSDRLRGLASPFEMPAQIVEVCADLRCALALFLRTPRYRGDATWRCLPFLYDAFRLALVSGNSRPGLDVGVPTATIR